MRVTKAVLIVYLATWLSVGLLSACNDSVPKETSFSPLPTASPSATKATADPPSQNPDLGSQYLDAFIERRKELDTFVATIEVNEDNTIKKIPNNYYSQAKSTVDKLAEAYDTFKNSLSNEIKQNRNFDEVDSQIKDVLASNSSHRQILDYLKNSKYRDAQKKLSQIKDDDKPIYTGPIDGEDGTKQQIATKNLLKTFLSKTKPLENKEINSLFNQNLTNLTDNYLTSDELKQELERLIKDINHNSWMFTLLNALALFTTVGSLFFLGNKLSRMGLIPEIKKKRKQEQKIDIQQFHNDIVAIKTDIKKNKNKLDIQQQLDKIYNDVILQHLGILDPTQDLIQKSIEKLLNNYLTAQDDNILNVIMTKLDRFEQLLPTLQNSQEHLSARLSNEYNAMLNQIRDQLQNLPSESSPLNYTIELLNYQLLKHQEICNKLIREARELRFELESQNKSEDKTKNYQLIKNLQDEREKLQQQLEQSNSEEIELTRQKNRSLEQQYRSYEQKNQELENQVNSIKEDNNNLQKNNSYLSQDISKMRDYVQDLEAQRDRYKADSERYKKAANKQAIETTEIPLQWQSIIDYYNQLPESIFNVSGVQRQGEVLEDGEKGMERRNNTSKPVVLSSDTSPDGFYIVSVGADYLLFPKQLAIAPSQKFTASALFDGYKSANTSKFILISPAQVNVFSNGMWQLKHKGRLEYN